jgi:hypothetical protein
LRGEDIMEAVNSAVAIYLCGIMVVLGIICVWGEAKNRRPDANK